MPNNLVFIVMDSCRFDSFASARTPTMDRLGPADRRYSYASWTSPSHFTYLMGMVPHTNPQGVFASEVYKGEFAKWVERLAIPGLAFRSFVPNLSLPKVLQEHGYRTIGRVSLPVLNPFSGMGRHFDDYRLMDNHNDFAGMVRATEFTTTQPSFFFFNLGETHYPYMLDPASMPHISGVHGVFKRMDDGLGEGDEEPRFFDASQMADLHAQQARCVEHVDSLLDELVSRAPVGTHFIVTSDHGECFGEGGFFGHGPIMHPKVFEIPFIEGTKR
jgi:hypothetical protein